METFQKIYRPEIYNANAAAGSRYKPNLKNDDHSLTQIVYDRAERGQLAVEQGKFTEQHFIKPYQSVPAFFIISQTYQAWLYIVLLQFFDSLPVPKLYQIYPKPLQKGNSH